MALSHDNSVIVINGQQPSVMSAQQPSPKFIYPIIAEFCIWLQKSCVVVGISWFLLC